MECLCICSHREKLLIFVYLSCLQLPFKVLVLILIVINFNHLLLDRVCNPTWQKKDNFPFFSNSQTDYLISYFISETSKICSTLAVITDNLVLLLIASGWFSQALLRTQSSLSPEPRKLPRSCPRGRSFQEPTDSLELQSLGRPDKPSSLSTPFTSISLAQAAITLLQSSYRGLLTGFPLSAPVPSSCPCAICPAHCSQSELSKCKPDRSYKECFQTRKPSIELFHKGKYSDVPY